MSNIILHHFQGNQIGLRYLDCYINATAMSAAHKEKTGKRRDVTDWLRLARTKETLEHLSPVTGIPVTGLVFVQQGGTPSEQGTWIHPRLAVRFGIWLSDDFGLAVENWVVEWSALKQQRQNAEWIEARNTGKRSRKQETDGIKLFVEYAKAQGSQSAEKYYTSISKMENAALFLVEQKYPNLRDVLGVAELGLIAVADTIVFNALRDGIEQAMHYKDIYKLAKQRVETLGFAHGRVLVPSSSGKILQLDQSPPPLGTLNL
jgi:KilA-N domain